MLTDKQMIPPILDDLPVSEGVELESSYLKDIWDKDEVLKLVLHELGAVGALGLVIQLDEDLVRGEGVDPLVRLPGGEDTEHN